LLKFFLHHFFPRSLTIYFFECFISWLWILCSNIGWCTCQADYHGRDTILDGSWGCHPQGVRT
jgi:hypothetical protein